MAASSPPGSTVGKVEDEWQWSASIITRPARDASGEIHDRMPVFLESDVWERAIQTRSTSFWS